MTQEDFLKALHTRTAFSCLQVAILAINQLKHGETHKKRQRLSMVEKSMEGYIKTIEASITKREGVEQSDKMKSEFDKTTDFINAVIEIAAAIPNHPELQANILTKFEALVEDELKQLDNTLNQKQ